MIQSIITIFKEATKKPFKVGNEWYGECEIAITVNGIELTRVTPVSMIEIELCLN